MSISEKIHQAYAAASNYPDLAQRLSTVGVQSYTVEVSSHIILYHLAAGAIELQAGSVEPQIIEPRFDQVLTRKAIRDNQEGKTDYAGFMSDIARAGVRFYEAILTGPDKRVVYVGIGGFYEERIPVV